MADENDSEKKMKLIDSILEEHKDFLHEMDEWDEENQQILSRYEKIETKGQILVDGHHVFLGLMSSIDKFNYLLAEEKRDKRQGVSSLFADTGIPNIWQDAKPRHVAEFLDRTVMSLSELIPETIASRMFPGSRRPLATSKILLNNRLNIDCSPDDYYIVTGDWDMSIFDARLPDRSEMISRLNAQWNRFHKWGQHYEKQNIERWMDKVKDGKWSFWYEDNGYIDVPYDTKNRVLDYLDKRLDHSVGEGKRRITFNNKGYVHQKEKGVDSKLVIAGCEAARDPSVDWICLVLNDTDYLPLVEHIQSTGKDLYLLGWTNKRRQARDLVELVGQDNIINRDELHGNFFRRFTKPSKFDSWVKASETDPTLHDLMTFGQSQGMDELAMPEAIQRSLDEDF